MSVPLSDLMEDESEPVFTLDWRDEQIPEEARVTGSVVEFAFGPVENSYLATSYPYRAEYADVKDTRKVAKKNIPLPVIRQMARLQPRYIMNLAFRPNSNDWFIFCYRSRTAYDAKWEPRKPSRRDSVGGILDEWRRDARDQVSFCAFGESIDTWFMRSTDPLTEWHPQLCKNASPKLDVAFVKAVRRMEIKYKRNGKPVQLTKLRAVTFGHGGTWVLYSTDTFQWSEHGLPKALTRALELGQQEKWDINKVVLNPRNPNEYVLVYDHGPVYCSFQPQFQQPFREILAQWSEKMRECGRYESHDYEPDYHWEPPSDAEFAEDNEPVSDVDDYDNPTATDVVKSSAPNNVRPSQSRDGEVGPNPSQPRHYSNQSQQTNRSDPSVQDDAQGKRSSLEDGNGGVLVHDPGMYVGGTAPTQRENALADQLHQTQEELRRLQQQLYQFMHQNQTASMGTHSWSPHATILQPNWGPNPSIMAPAMPNRGPSDFQVLVPGSGPPHSMGYQVFQPLHSMPPEQPQQYLPVRQQQQHQERFQSPHHVGQPVSQTLPERDEEQELRLRSGTWRSPTSMVQEQLNSARNQQVAETPSGPEPPKKGWPLIGRGVKKPKEPANSSGRR